jgi:PAS domain S-box-containing protein
MKRPSENKWDTMREKIIGLGEQSIRKGYYPELQQRISELEKFRLLLDQSNDIIFLIDIISGVLTDVNEAAFRLLGYKKEELYSIKIADLSSEKEKIMEIFSPETEDKKNVTINTHLKKYNGEYIPVEMTINKVNLNNIIYAVAVARDITERIKNEEEKRKLEIKLQQTQKLESLGLMAGGIAHDFNNILVGIFNYTEMAMMELSGHPEISEILNNVIISAERAKRLIKQLLAFSGKDEPSFKPVNLTEIVKDAKPLLIMAIGKECNIEYNLKSEINYIKADETQMLQLIMNLAINSKEAMFNPYKFITIKTDEMECNKDYFADSYWFQDVEEGIYVCLEVADTGCGMSKKVISRIFDPFFTTKSEGKGLGLATVLGIVRKHKGAIKINSKPGEGTRFQILFPALLQPVSKSQ